MAWRKKCSPKTTKESNMIEHSICKYKPPQPTIVSVAYTPPTKHAGLQKWSKQDVEDYIANLEKRGYTPGKFLTTKWQLCGVMLPFNEVPEKGLQFYGKATPDVIRIRSFSGAAQLTYNEDEIVIISSKEPIETEYQLC